MKTRALTYATAGVDVIIEAKVAKLLYQAAKKTWQNRTGLLGEVVVPVDDFSGLRFIRVANLPKGTVFYGGSDGVATKTELAERAGRFDTLAYDLMAMICDDAVIRGAEPIAVKTVLTVNTLGQDASRLPFIRQLAKGYVAAAKVAGVAVINGEIAQHNDRMGRLETFSLDWSGDVTWFGHESRLITGFAVKPEDYVIGLRETGLRSNGISLVRECLRKLNGSTWEKDSLNGKRLIDLALAPSRIYAQAIVDMTGGWDLKRKPKAQIHGLAHISGGGLPEKLGRALKPTGYGAIIDTPFDPSPIMTYCQQAGISDYEAYRTWNMGQGMVVITPSPDEVIAVAKAHKIQVKVIGRITKQPRLTIHSRGVEQAVLRY